VKETGINFVALIHLVVNKLEKKLSSFENYLFFFFSLSYFELSIFFIFFLFKSFIYTLNIEVFDFVNDLPKINK